MLLASYNLFIHSTRSSFVCSLLFSSFFVSSFLASNFFSGGRGLLGTPKIYAENLSKLWLCSIVSLGIRLTSQAFVTCASHKLATICVGVGDFCDISMFRGAHNNANNSGAKTEPRKSCSVDIMSSLEHVTHAANAVSC